MIVLLTNACECACAIRTEVVNIFAGYLEIIYPFDGVLTKVECRQGLWRWGKEYATCAIYPTES